LKKTVKILAIIAAAVVGFFILLAIALPFLIDPNQYKQEITTLVKEQTGRELVIEGDIGLSVFPWIGMEIGKTQLSNAQEFGTMPFASINAVDVKVALIPLFSKQVVVKNVTLDGLHLNLMIGKSGTTNWDDLAGPKKTEAIKEEQPAEPVTAEGDIAQLAALSVGGINVRNAEVVWDDKSSDTYLALHKLNFKTGRVQLGQPVSLSVDALIESQAPAFQLPMKLTTTLAADFDKQVLDITQLDFALSSLSFHAKVSGKNILEAPAFQGSVALEPFNLAALLKQLGTEVSFADANALTKVGLKADINTQPNQASGDNLVFTLDDTTIKGKFSLKNFEQPQYNVELALDNIDIDRYLPPTSDTPEQPSETVKTAGPPPSLAPLRDVFATGKLTIGKLKVAGLKASDIDVTLDANGGLVKLDSIKAKLYEGGTSGSVVVDARPQEPLLQFAQKLSGVQIGPLLKDMDITGKFEGKGEVNVDLSTKGLTEKSIAKNLNGSASFALRDGSLKGVNFIKMAKEGREKIKELMGKTVSAEPKTGDATVYETIQGTAKITNGLAKNDDFIMKSPQGNITGKGEADLGQDKINYRVEVKEAGESGKSIPILVYGKLSSPKFKLDFSQAAKQAVEKKVEQKKTQIKEKASEQLKEKAKDKFKNLLRR